MDDDAIGRTWVLRRVVLRDAVVLQPVQERGLASVIQTEEQDFRIFVRQACRSHTKQQPP
jgi:hypothetical protein